MALVVVLPLLLSATIVDVVVANADKQLLAEGIKHAAECAATNKIDFHTCTDLFKDDAKLDDPKYDQCKCWVPCVAKKMKVMKDDGNWDHDAVEKMISTLQDADWRAEGERVFGICKQTTGSGCDAGFNAFECALKNSEKSHNYIKTFLMAMTGQKA